MLSSRHRDGVVEQKQKQQQKPGSSLQSRSSSNNAAELATERCYGNRSAEAAAAAAAAACDSTRPRSLKSQSERARQERHQEQEGPRRGGQSSSNERSSSFENLYDEADLSMQCSTDTSMNRIDWLDFRWAHATDDDADAAGRYVTRGRQKDGTMERGQSSADPSDQQQLSVANRIKQLQERMQAAADEHGAARQQLAGSVATSSGRKTNDPLAEASVSVQTTRSRHTRRLNETVVRTEMRQSSSSRFSFGGTTTGAGEEDGQASDEPRSPSWYVPKASEDYDRKDRATGTGTAAGTGRKGEVKDSKAYDAKVLVEEEKQKFEQYKRDYRRRLSERESTSGDETRADGGSREDSNSQLRQVSG